MSISKKVFLCLTFLCLPAVGPLFVPGYFGASDDLHIAWLQQFTLALKSGQLPVRYVPDLSYGFGYPLFNFVFPLPFYSAVIPHLLGLSLVASIKLILILSLILSAYVMYWTVKPFANRYSSLAASLIYIYTPYRSTDIYVRGAIGEAVAFIFFPLVLGGILRIFVSPISKKSLAITSLGVAGLILSHNISAYMFAPAAAVLALILGFKHRSGITKLIIAGILGLVISLFFWLPALKDSQLVVYSTVFNYADHFPTIKQLLTPYWGWGASVPGPYDGMSFYLGSINILVLILGIITLVFRRNRSSISDKTVIWALIVCFSAVVFMNFRSSFLWDKLPLIGYFQFPWRFLLLTTTCTSVISALVLTRIKYLSIVVVVISILLLLEGWKFHPHDYLGRQDDYYLSRYIPVPSPSADYVHTQEEYLRLPKSTQTRPNKLFPRFFPNENISSIQTLNDFSAIAITNSSQPFNLNYNKYAFPGWQVDIDGQLADFSPGSPYGQIQFSVPQGDHKITVSYKETPMNILLDILSLAGLIFASILIFL